MTSLLAALLASSLVFIQCYISGTRMAFSLPAYLLLGVAGILTLAARRERGSTPSKGCLWATFLMGGYLLARASFSPVEYLARADYYMVLACLLVYGITAIFITGRTLRMSILWTIFALAAVEVVIGTRQFAYEDNWMPFGLIRRGVPVAARASGTFNNPISLAGFLEAVAPFALAMAFWGARKLWVRLLSGYLAAICYFGVAITGSRGGWLSSIVSLLLFLAFSVDLIRRCNPRKFPMALYLSIFAGLAIPTGGFLLMQRNQMLSERMDLLARIADPKEKVPDVRVFNWAAALDQWKEGKWAGTGAGTHLYYGRKYRRKEVQADPEHAHSDYLELLAEYGLAGALVVGLFLLAHGRSGWRGYRELANLRAEMPYQHSHELALNLGAMSAFAAYLAHSAVDFNLHLPGNALFMAFVFGLLSNPGPSGDETGPDSDFAHRGEPVEKERWGPLWARLPWPALGVWMLWSGAPKLPGEIWCERARVAVREGDYDAGIAFAEKALKWEDRNPYLYYHLGQAHRLKALGAPRITREDEMKQAEAAYRNGLALFPLDEDLHIRLAQTLDALARYREAGAEYEEAIRLDPNHGLLYAYYAEHLNRIGDSAKSDEVRAKGQSLTSLNLSTYFSEELDKRENEAQPAPPKPVSGR